MRQMSISPAIIKIAGKRLTKLIKGYEVPVIKLFLSIQGAPKNQHGKKIPFFK